MLFDESKALIHEYLHSRYISYHALQVQWKHVRRHNPLQIFIAFHIQASFNAREKYHLENTLDQMLERQFGIPVQVVCTVQTETETEVIACQL